MANDFVNVKSHARKERLLTGYFISDCRLPFATLQRAVVINGPAKRLLNQIGAKKGVAETCACVSVEVIFLSRSACIKYSA